MNPARPLQPRTKFLVTLLSCLLICALPLIILISVLRFLSRIFGGLTGRTRVSTAKAKKEVRKATRVYNFAKRRYLRASGKLAKAQAALDTVQKPAQKTPATAPEAELDTEPAATSPAGSLGSGATRFLFGLLKTLINYLIDRNLKKAV